MIVHGICNGYALFFSDGGFFFLMECTPFLPTSYKIRTILALAGLYAAKCHFTNFTKINHPPHSFQGVHLKTPPDNHSSSSSAEVQLCSTSCFLMQYEALVNIFYLYYLWYVTDCNWSSHGGT